MILEQARTRAGLSQRALAKQAEVSHSHIAYIESGERTPSPGIVKKLADALSVSVDTLMGR